ncbi:helix-turn-helix domain-containing protein [Paenibacillus tepidiphilus]|uniref:helix-turn-helix domain-containing protein n=1 Tax=Paenibacillus tepidiphilus TaxID=2608683 RepID=UPI00123ABDFB|nr:helix-turn-helix domain-containing protein [Paenibacillus tepidiphilus]
MKSLYTPVQFYSPVIDPAAGYREWKPCKALEDSIYCYWYMPRCSGFDPARLPAGRHEMIAPDGCIDIVLRIEPSTAAECLIVGTLERSLMADLEVARMQTVGIRFYPGGLQRFLREPACLFTNQIRSLGEVSRAFAAELQEVIGLSGSAPERIRGLEQYLLGRWQRSDVRDAVFRNALNTIYLAKGDITVKELSRRECVSEKQLGRIFREHAGVGTKTFARIIRFQHALTALHTPEIRTLTDAAIGGGYYDQAHFIHEFKSFSGLLPSDYREMLPGLSVFYK